MGTVLVPKSGNTDDKDTIDDISSLVVVGANGSGKSRLGAWIEENPPVGVETHRVSAQRALEIADQIKPHGLDLATKLFRFGQDDSRHSTFHCLSHLVALTGCAKSISKRESRMLDSLRHLPTGP